MPTQRPSTPWAPSEIDAQRLTDQVRAARLTVLCGGPAAPTPRVLQAGVLPLVNRRSTDRTKGDRASAKSLAFEDRRHGSGGSDAEVAVLFDQWTGPARAALGSALQEALRGHGAVRSGKLPQRFGDMVIALSERHRVRFLFLFDRFEACLLAPPDNGDLRALREEIFSAVNRAQVPAHFLLTLREDGEPLLDRLRGRIRGFDPVRKPWPLDGAQGIGPWTLSWVPPVMAPARGRPPQTQAVYASIESLLGQMAQRSGQEPAEPLSAEDEALLASVPGADSPPLEAPRDPLSGVFGSLDFAVDGLGPEASADDAPSPLAEDAHWAAFDARPPTDRADAPPPVGNGAVNVDSIGPTTPTPVAQAEAPSDGARRSAAWPEPPGTAAALGTPSAEQPAARGAAFSTASLDQFMAELDDVIADSLSTPAAPAPVPRVAPVLADLERWTDVPWSGAQPNADRPRTPATDEPAGSPSAADPVDDDPASADATPALDGAAPGHDASGDERADAATRGIAVAPEEAGEIDALPPGAEMRAPGDPDITAPEGEANDGPPTAWSDDLGRTDAPAAESPAALAPPESDGSADDVNPTPDAALNATRPPKPRRWPLAAAAAGVAALAAVLLVPRLGRAPGPGTAVSDRAADASATATAPPAAGAADVVLSTPAVAPLVELSAAGPLAQSLADELALTLPLGGGPTLLTRSSEGWSEDLAGLQQPGRLAIVRQDALQAARADPALGPLQIVLPLFSEELVFVVRADSPLRYIHQIDGRRLSVGAPETARALTVRAAYEQLFGRPLPADRTDASDEPEALRELLEGRVDVVALVGTVPGSWPVAPVLSDASELRLLRLDRGHPASQRALRSLLAVQLAAGVDGLPAAQPTPTLAVRSFLVAGASPGSETSASDLGGLARAVCKQLPTLQRDGHVKWREVRLGALPQASWPYAPEAAFAVQDCVGRVPVRAAGAPVPAANRSEPDQP